MPGMLQRKHCVSMQQRTHRLFVRERACTDLMAPATQPTSPAYRQSTSILPGERAHRSVTPASLPVFMNLIYTREAS